jgi:TPR repeat protein
MSELTHKLAAAVLLLLVSEQVTQAQTNSQPNDQFLLGRAYERGEGVTQSYEQAGSWYRKAAESGNLKAMVNLGGLYLNGEGLAPNPAEAYNWFHKASEQGDLRGLSMTGILMCDGKGITKNQQDGMAALKKAAEGGDRVALSRLGQDYLFGDDGVNRSSENALPYLIKAADQSDPWSCGILGHLYLGGGDKITPDIVKSEYWFERGAKLGDSYSQLEYAKLLFRTNAVAAYPWIKLASMHSKKPEAMQRFMEVTSHMTQAQISEAEKDLSRIQIEYRLK